MICAIHATKMIKEPKTGMRTCMMCDKVDAIMDELHDLGEWEYTIKDIESYLRGPDTANIGEYFTEKKKDSNE